MGPPPPLRLPVPPPPPGRGTAVADLLASLVVFMVALPLCIGIAKACGLPPEAGIFTGVVGGLLVGLLAGSPLQVSGPAAGLIVLVIDFLANAQAARPGANPVPALGLAILLAGGFQILAGVFRLGQWFRAVSPSVVDGMLAGIGVTIIAKQFHVMVDDEPPKDIVGGLLAIPRAVGKALSPTPPETAFGVGAEAGGPGFVVAQRLIPNHDEAAVLGLLSIAVLAGWKLLKPAPFQFVPSAVVAVLAAVLVNEFGRPLFEAAGANVGPAVDQHGGLGVRRVAVSANLLDGLTPLHDHWPGWELLLSGLVWKAAAAFALIASAETLLCSVAVDTMHGGPRTQYDKELVAQGVGNLVCGWAGALPMTGVIVRSSANVDAGAKTRLSAVLHGVWLLLFVMLLPDLLSRIPLAALAAVLVYTGWKLLNLPGLWKLWRQDRGEAAIFAATATAIVVEDLLIGVALGVVLSAGRVLWLVSSLIVTRTDSADGRRVDLHLDGAGTFLKLPALAETLEAVPAGTEVHVHLERVRLVDHAVLTLLTTFQKQHEAKGGRVVLDWASLNSGPPAEKANSGFTAEGAEGAREKTDITV